MKDEWYCIGSKGQAERLFFDRPWLIEKCAEMLENCPSVVVRLYEHRNRARWSIHRAENYIQSWAPGQKVTDPSA
jgi:hypothetical protein